MKYFLSFLLSIAIFLSGCGGSGGDSAVQTYTLSLEKSYALLGPLKDAEIRIYSLKNLEDPIFISKTLSDGAFPDVSKLDVEDDEFLLVEVSGGCDIDKNDDGILDSVCTVNHGTLRAFVRYSELKNGGIRVTVLSDMIYHFLEPLKTRIAEGSWNSSDFGELLDTLSKVLGATEYKEVLSFSPLNRPSWLYGDIDYRKLAEYYLKGDEKEIISKAVLIASRSDFHPGDKRFLELRNKVKFNLAYSEEDISLSLSVDDDSVRPDIAYLPKESKNIVIKVDEVKNGNKFIGWMGCDSFKGNTCFIKELNDDRIVAPVVVKEMVRPDNVKIFDLSSSIINLKESEIPLNSTLLDSFDVRTENKTLYEDIAKALKEGGTLAVVVNKNDPVFFRKITGISGNETVFTLKTSYIELTDIFTDGYISTIPSDDVKLISSSIILSDGKEIPYDSKTQKIVLDFNTKTAYVLPKTDITRLSYSNSGYFGWSETYNDTFGPVHFDSGNATTLNGTIEIEPFVDFTYSWKASVSWDDVDVSITSAYLNTGCNLSVNGTFIAEFKKEFNKHEVWYEELKYKQTFYIYGIPVIVTEKIPLVYGIRGIGTGKKSDNATIYGNVTLNFDSLINPAFQVTYTGGELDSRFIFNPVFKESGEANLRAHAFAYLGAEPSIAVYGVGIKMNNYIGPYGLVEVEFDGNASQTVSFDYTEMSPEDICLSYNGTVKLKGELGLGYYGRILGMTELETKLSKKLIDKLNDSIRGKYTEFWKQYALISVSKVTTISGVSDKGVLSVEGPSGMTEVVYEGESLNKELRYTLKNIGGKDLNWRAASSADSDISISISPANGTLGPNESQEVVVSVTSSPSITEAEFFNGHIYFFNNSAYDTKTITKSSTTPVFSMNTVFSPLNNPDFSFPLSVMAVPAIEGWNATLWYEMEYFPYEKLVLGWNEISNGTQIDGYAIMYSDSDGNSCSDNFKVFAYVENGNSYSAAVSSLIYSGKLEENKDYCFRVYAFKNQPVPDPVDFHIIGYLPLYWPPEDNEPEIIYIPSITDPFSISTLPSDIISP